jgi:predicted outer membrane repeat protein
MKKIYLFIGLITLVYLSFGQTNVPAGYVSGTWALSNSPYNIQGSIEIPDGSTLTIEPGVIVNFQGAYKLNVQGRLLATGTANDSIIFTTSNTIQGWRGIRFDGTPATNDTSKIVYCKLQFGKASGSSDHDRYGGALYFQNVSKVMIHNCNISNNQADTYGGAIFCTGSPIDICSNVISNNKTNGFTWGGGAIACFNSNLTLTNNTITNNMSVGSSCGGGGILLSAYSIPVIKNNIIVNNSSNNGGGIYCTDGSCPILINTILWGNTATHGSQVFVNTENSDPDFYYCNVQGGFNAIELNGNFYNGTYSNNIDSVPQFVAPSNGSGTGYNGTNADWSLQSTSPCIDAGDPNGTYPATDIIGNPRVTVCRIDIGAYEYQNGISLVVLLSITQPILCHGEATGEIIASASGGIGPYTYLWNNGQTTNYITGLIAGTYIVTVSEEGGCALTDSITISEPPIFSVDAGQDKTIISELLTSSSKNKYFSPLCNKQK